MKKFIFSIALIFAAMTTFAQVNPNAPLERDPAVLYGKLDNGMTYYIMHNDKPAQRAEYYLLTDVGAIQETPAQDGLAHFLEHMCLNGTKNFPGKDLISYFESIGAQFGPNINASTGVEQTMYMLNNIPTTREGIVDSALLVMHDYAGFVTNDPVEIDKERGVIIEEWRTRRTADWRTVEKQWATLYKGSKYETCTVIGSKTNLETFPAEELVKFYKTWYRPDMQAVVVVGDVNPQAILAKLNDLFKDIPAQENPQPKEMYKIPGNDTPIVGIATDPELRFTSTMAVIKGEPLPKAYQEYGVGFMNDLVEDIIGSLFSERLDDIARKADAPFLGAFAGYQRFTQTMEGFSVQANSKDGEALKAFEAVLSEVEKAKRYGFTQAEYDRVKANMINQAERATSNAESRKNPELVYQFISDFYYNSPFMAPAYRESQTKGYLELIPLAQINQIVSTIAFDKNVVIFYSAPEKEGLTHPAEQDFIDVISKVANSQIEANAEEEELGELVDASLLKGSKVKKESKGLYGSTVWNLKNGIRVTVRPSDYNKEQVLFNIRAFGGQSLIEDADIPSLDDNMMVFYNNMGGVSDFSMSKLAKMLTGKTVNVNAYINDINHGVNGNCAPKDFETMMQLVYLAIANPRFEAEEMAPAFAQMNAIVPNLEKQPTYAFGKEYMKTAYGDNPRRQLISSEKLNKISFESFEKSYRKLFSNMKGAEVVITGNVDLETIKPLVEKYIGSLPVEKKATKLIDRNVDIVPGEIDDIFDFEMATPKTTCMLIASGNTKGNLENRFLAQALSDCLNLIYTETIREDEGGTYGVGTQCTVTSIPKEREELLIQFDTDPDRAQKLIQLAIDGLKSVAENGPTEEQMNKITSSMLKNIPENRINNSYWSGCIMNYYNTGVDLDTDREAVINGLTAEKIQKFTADLLAQKNFIKIVMNPAAK